MVQLSIQYGIINPPLFELFTSLFLSAVPRAALGDKPTPAPKDILIARLFDTIPMQSPIPDSKNRPYIL